MTLTSPVLPVMRHRFLTERMISTKTATYLGDIRSRLTAPSRRFVQGFKGRENGLGPTRVEPVSLKGYVGWSKNGCTECGIGVGWRRYPLNIEAWETELEGLTISAFISPFLSFHT